MQLPDFLSKMTGAQAFAAPGAAPTFGDGLQGIGHSMMEHYRRNQMQPQMPQMPMPSASAGQGPPRPGPSTIAPQDLGQTFMPMGGAMPNAASGIQMPGSPLGLLGQFPLGLLSQLLK